MELIPILSLAIATGALIYAGRQFRLSFKLARQEFMLKLFDKMDSHNELHAIMTHPDGVDPDFPTCREDWIRVGRLLGLFEHMAYLVEEGLLTTSQVQHAFYYRLEPLLNHSKIRDFIYKNNRDWDDLKILVKRVENFRAHK